MAKDDQTAPAGKALATLASIGVSSATTEDAPLPEIGLDYVVAQGTRRCES